VVPTARLFGLTPDVQLVRCSFDLIRQLSNSCSPLPGTEEWALQIESGSVSRSDVIFHRCYMTRIMHPANRYRSGWCRGVRVRR
jgi:hypothetical protein